MGESQIKRKKNRATFSGGPFKWISRNASDAQVGVVHAFTVRPARRGSQGVRRATYPQISAVPRENRRHMTKGQRAMAVARIYPEGGRGKAPRNLELGAERVRQARTALRYGPDLADNVLTGAAT